MSGPGNLSREGFARWLRGLIEAKIPFRAYWYAGGYGILKTGPIVYINASGKPATRKASKKTLDQWDKNLRVLQKAVGFSVITCEYDGENIEQSGGLEL